MLNRVLQFISTVMLICFLSGAVLLAQNDFSQVEIKTIPVAEGIYMLEGAGGNIGVSAGGDGVFMIDDQFAPLSEKIKQAVDPNNLGDRMYPTIDEK